MAMPLVVSNEATATVQIRLSSHESLNCKDVPSIHLINYHFCRLYSVYPRAILDCVIADLQYFTLWHICRPIY
eukprot:scaffold483574_cov19-Prasinocladus_malaysianus.AAC.2